MRTGPLNISHTSKPTCFASGNQLVSIRPKYASRSRLKTISVSPPRVTSILNLVVVALRDQSLSTRTSASPSGERHSYRGREPNHRQPDIRTTVTRISRHFILFTQKFADLIRDLRRL